MFGVLVAGTFGVRKAEVKLQRHRVLGCWSSDSLRFPESFATHESCGSLPGKDVIYGEDLDEESYIFGV